MMVSGKNNHSSIFSCILPYILYFVQPIFAGDDDDDDDDAKKFKILVKIGKKFYKSNNFNLCIDILKTALTSHCSLSKSSAWLNDTENKGMEFSKGNYEIQHSLDCNSKHFIAPSKNHGLSSMYLTTGCHGDLSETKLDEDKTDKLPTVDSHTLMSALVTLSLSYFSLNKLKQALLYSKQCLLLALECESKKYELKSYVQLANIYQRLGDHLQAISYNGKLLAVGRDLEKYDTREHEAYWSNDVECKAVWNLSAAYKSLGDLKTALGYAHEYMDLLKIIDQENLTVAYSNLGELELLLGNHNSALEYHKMELRLSKKFDDKEALAYAYGNVGKVYAAMKNFKQSEINHMQHLKLAQSISDRVCELVAVKQFGDMFMLMGEYKKALEEYEKHLGQVKVNKLEDRLQCQVYGLMGHCYLKLNQLYRAQHYFEQSLRLAGQINDKQEELNSRHCLAKIMKALGLYENCRQYYNEVIPVLEHRLYIKQENNVMYEGELVDKLAGCYGDLQEVLIEMGCVKEALEICEHCKSRVLVNILRSRDVLKTEEADKPADHSPYTAEEIFKLVDSSESLVLMYSCVASGFMSWLLSPVRGLVKFYRYKNCEHISIEDRIKDCIENIHVSHESSYKCDQRSLPYRDLKVSLKTEGGQQQRSSCFVCDFSNSNLTPLQKLYNILLEPFRDELQREDGLPRRLFIVPDVAMNMIPFPSLQNQRGEHLYEHFNVSIMPCARALSLKSYNQKEVTSEDFKILVAGNPKIPSVDLYGVAWQPPGEGVLAEKEVTSMATLLGVGPVTGCQATKERIIETLSQSSLAHLVTYGSWKKGCLAFTPNIHCYGDRPPEDSYLMSVSDLLAVDLTAKMVVISSCCSCSHKFCYLKQVNLSLATALLAAGAQAVIVPLWSVEQPTLLKFYYHLYSGLEKVTS
jgi:tetratricopeptide (TPR) repeat protein/CHAT domain-containing protein